MEFNAGDQIKFVHLIQSCLGKGYEMSEVEEEEEEEEG
eukprot:CAMPEP_0201536804 /NCGR_PEP_ID=MMETSP0161_2-20130828/63016_1 /ASSEMBLY_ACC=CAM_ASM_000251 /TAXON_ID=180227 /ORGANISM="Neoparamoeba aestuarina, Strain SoJaBio B1-5/56/2" /LENGTH=37 /DNA_ID= /DNA_START= /DNA_END= /DNA_ORIENTATION=